MNKRARHSLCSCFFVRFYSVSFTFFVIGRVLKSVSAAQLYKTIRGNRYFFLLSIGQAPKRMSESWMCWFTDCITSNLTMAKKNGECYVKGGIDLDEKTFCTQSNQSFGLLSPNQTRVSLLFHVCGVCVSSFAFAKCRFAYWYVCALQFTIVHFDIWCDNDTIYNGTKWHFGCIRMPSCTLFQFMRCKECFLRVCVCVYVSIYLIAVYLAFWLSVATVCYVSFRSLYILNAGHPC